MTFYIWAPSLPLEVASASHRAPLNTSAPLHRLLLHPTTCSTCALGDSLPSLDFSAGTQGLLYLPRESILALVIWYLPRLLARPHLRGIKSAIFQIVYTWVL